MNQERMNVENYKNTSTDTEYQLPDIESTINQAKSTLGKIRIVNGANEKYFDNLEGKTVGSARKSLRQSFNIAGDAVAYINGKEVGDDFILEGNMSLEFYKDAGEKGL